VKIRLEALAEQLGGTLEGNGSLEITGVAGLTEAGPGDVSFIAGEKHLGELGASRAGAVIAEEGIVSDKPLIRVSNAYLSFAETLEIFHPPSRSAAGIHPAAVVADTAAVDLSASVGPLCSVGDGVTVGPRTAIAAGCIVGDGASIGADTLLHPRVVVARGVRIGDRVIVQSGAVIGSDGFGYVQDGGKHRKIPQVGDVVVEDDVEIGANVTIDRATVGTTRIGRGTKIDNLVQIAHNVTVGEDSIIVALAGISGSTRIGRGVLLGGQVGVVGHVEIGDGARIGAQSGIMRSIAPGETASGIGPLPHRQWLRSQATFEKLPEMRRSLKDLEARIAALEKKDSGDEV
jgi:UDP-3-O-[3-hydroxymyristoyl] glucosamine N-acyltransferase